VLHASKLLLWVPPDEVKRNAAQGESTEHDILSIEVADDDLGEAEEDEGDGEVELHLEKSTDNEDEEAVPVLRVVEHTESIQWGADRTAFVLTGSVNPLRVPWEWLLARLQILLAVEEVEDEEEEGDDGVGGASSDKHIMAKSLDYGKPT